MHNYFNHALISDLKTRVFNGIKKGFAKETLSTKQDITLNH